MFCLPRPAHTPNLYWAPSTQNGPRPYHWCVFCLPRQAQPPGFSEDQKKKACVRESDTGAYVVRLAQRTPLTSPGLLQPEMDRDPITGAFVVCLSKHNPPDFSGGGQKKTYVFKNGTLVLCCSSVVCLSKHNPPVFSGDQNKKKNVCVQESNTGAMLFVSPRALPGPLLGSCNPKGSGWSSTIHMCVDCRPTRRLPVAKVSRWIDRGQASRGGHGPETTIF